MSSSRLIAIALLIATLSGAAPAGAQSTDDARRRQESVQRRRSEVAASLNALKASDAQLEAAVATLTAEVGRAEAKAAAARQAVAAAERQLTEATKRLASIEEALAGRRQAVVNRAVQAYMRPNSESMSSVLASKDLSEAARKQQFMNVVDDRDRDVIDELRAAEEDQRLAREQAQEAKKQADHRRNLSERELARVSQARSDQARLRDALDARIRSFQTEVEGLAREEAELAALISQRQRQVSRASRSAPAGESPGRVSGAGLIWPVRGPVTSEYGPRWGRMHNGIDISAPTGTPIRAAKAGRVIFVGQQGGYGNMTLVDHGGGFVTAYPHQSRFGTSEGASVSQGQVIGYVGCTGSCTGPHLHFETRVNGSAQNPRWYLP